MTKRPRVLLADDHKLVLEGFRRILEPEFEVVGTVEDGRSLLEAAPRLQPDIVIVDVALPLLNGIDAVRQLVRICANTKFVVCTMHSDRLYAVEALQAGARGFVPKHSKPNELLTAVRAVLRGEQYLPPELRAEIAAAPKRPASDARPPLTPRQREVLQLVAEGRANKEIAHLLGISLKAVEFHKATLKRKLSVNTTADLVRCAVKLGM